MCPVLTVFDGFGVSLPPSGVVSATSKEGSSLSSASPPYLSYACCPAVISTVIFSPCFTVKSSRNGVVGCFHTSKLKCTSWFHRSIEGSSMFRLMPPSYLPFASAGTFTVTITVTFEFASTFEGASMLIQSVGISPGQPEPIQCDPSPSISGFIAIALSPLFSSCISYSCLSPASILSWTHRGCIVIFGGSQTCIDRLSEFTYTGNGAGYGVGIVSFVNTTCAP